MANFILNPKTVTVPNVKDAYAGKKLSTGSYLSLLRDAVEGQNDPTKVMEATVEADRLKYFADQAGIPNIYKSQNEQQKKDYAALLVHTQQDIDVAQQQKGGKLTQDREGSDHPAQHAAARDHASAQRVESAGSWIPGHNTYQQTSAAIRCRRARPGRRRDRMASCTLRMGRMISGWCRSERCKTDQRRSAVQRPCTARLSKFVPIDSGQPAEPPAANLRQSIAYGVQQNPDEHAKLLKQQQLTGMTPEAAAPFVQQTQQAIDVESLNPEQMVSSHPRTAAWATNPDNAAVSGAEDLHRLMRIEQHAATMRAYTPSWQDKISDAAQNAYEFLGGSGSLKQRVFDYPLVRMGVGALRGTEELAGNAASFAGLHGNNPTGLNVLQRSARSLEPFNFGEDETGLDKLAANIGPMVPAVIASGGTSLLARTLGLSDKAAKVLAGLSVGGMFTADQGGKTFNAMKDQGASDYDARLAANRVAAITAPANALFGATDLVPLLRDNPFLASIGLGGATGASGQFAQNVVTGRPKTEGLASAALEGAAVQGGMHLGMGFMESMGEAVNEVEASKLRLRSQEKFQEAVGKIFQGDESLRIPAQEFVNYFVDKDIDPAEMANRVGVKNLTEAAAAGSDLEIPKENYFAKLDPEHQRGLLQDVVDPSTNMTTRQAAEGRQELDEWISGGGVEKLQGDFAAADAETQATPEWQKVYGDLKQRYVDAGESETAADSYAQLQANAISNLAKRAGLKPDELLALHNPKVVAGVSPDEVLHQGPVDSPEFKQWFGESKVTDEDGNPQVVYHGTGKSFDRFDLGEAGNGRGAAGEKAIFFSRDVETANHSAEVMGADGEGAQVMPAYLRMENPFVSKMKAYNSAVMVKEIAKAKRLGHDGIEFPNLNTVGESGTVAVFSPEQVKSATGNRGTFDRNDANILHQDAPEGSRGWFKVLPDGRYEIGKTKLGDFSTFIHEPAHAYLELFRELTQREGASDELKKGLRQNRRVAGHDSGRRLQERIHARAA
jgi:hypothetical protein